MQIGIDSFVASDASPPTGIAVSPAQRLSDLLEEIGLADQVGLDVFGRVGDYRIIDLPAALNAGLNFPAGPFY